MPIVLEGEGWAAAFSELTLDDGTPALVGLDRVWAFGAAVVGSPTPELAQALASVPRWRVAFLPGGAPGGPYEQALVGALLAPSAAAPSSDERAAFTLVAGEPTMRLVAYLDEDWFARRSARFRQRLRQARARAPIEFVVCDDTIDFGRLLAIETHSHKGLAGSGITSPDMARMYRLLVDQRAANRCVIARHRGTDVGFILGAVHHITYRGLQISYVESARAWSVGNLLQWHEVQRHPGFRYDLGMDVTYKRHWADVEEVSRTVVVIRGQPASRV